MIIKFLLVSALACAAYLLVHGKRSALSLLVRRVLTLSAIAVGAVAVLFPDTVTDLAHLVGVGRGVDLIVYVLCVTFLFTTIGLHLRLAAMHDQFVQLARGVALSAAEREIVPSSPASSESGL